MKDEKVGDLIRSALPVHEAPAWIHEWAREQARGASEPTVRTLQPGSPSRRGPSRLARRAAYAAALVVAATVGWTAHGRLGAIDERGSARALEGSLIDTHVRSLMAGHLTDVQSTDQHTVKPWFVGKTDFAPRVLDLASSGFPLVGGRLDYVQGHDAVALVYGRRKHVVNLFIWPARPGDAIDANTETGASTTYRGFALRSWRAAGMTYWAISDAAASELEAFQGIYMTAP